MASENEIDDSETTGEDAGARLSVVMAVVVMITSSSDVTLPASSFFDCGLYGRGF